jgi:hypothetical protein
MKKILLAEDDEYCASLLMYSVIENFGYRQMHAWWRFRGTLQKLFGVSSWGRMERRGFAR